MKKIIVILLLLLVGCDNKKTASNSMPEVSDENCQIEKIMQIEDKETRETFAGLCSRRTKGIRPTKKPTNWLELTNPDNQQ